MTDAERAGYRQLAQKIERLNIVGLLRSYACSATATELENILRAALDAAPAQQKVKRQCTYCKEWCAHEWCGRCCRALPDAAPAAPEEQKMEEEEHHPLCSIGQWAGDQRMPCDCDGLVASPGERGEMLRQQSSRLHEAMSRCGCGRTVLCPQCVERRKSADALDEAADLVQRLTAERDAYRHDRDVEKHMRKDSDDRAATIDEEVARLRTALEQAPQQEAERIGTAISDWLTKRYPAVDWDTSGEDSADLVDHLTMLFQIAVDHGAERAALTPPAGTERRTDE